MKILYSPPCYRTFKEYPMYIGENILNELNKKIKPFNPTKVIIITDDNVKKLYGKKVLSLIQKEFESELLSIPPGEENKTPDNYLNLCNNILKKGVTKKSFILLLGGGIVGNLGGFAASTIMRGIPFAYIPTTIMAQADSTTGGKQGVNTIVGKNLLGLFNDPVFVLIDMTFLKTLPPREIGCGLAECIKHALCQDSKFFKELVNILNPKSRYSLDELNWIINKTIDIKLRVLRFDPKEINEGKVLVYGHTIGHAIETLSKGKLNHGESISIGMVCAAQASKLLKFANEDLVEQHKKALEKAGLPIKIPKEITPDKIIDQLKYDKKYGKGMELVLLESIGKLKQIEGKIGLSVEPDFIRKVLDLCY